MSSSADGTETTTPVEPRYASVMPWVLIVLAIALAAYGMHIRPHVTTSSRVTERVATSTAAGSPPSTPPRPTSKLVPDKQTTTDSAPSDALLGVLFGAAAVLALAGAFYSRVTKISLPGGAGIELAALSSDLDKIQAAIPAKVQKEIEGLPEAQRRALNATDIARIGSAASIGAQRELLQVRAAARGAPAAPAVKLPMAEVTRAQKGMPLSDDLISRLVEKAVGEAVKTDAPGGNE